MRARMVETENVRRLARVIDQLLDAHEGMPRLGLVTGHVGLGKSWAVDDAYVNRGLVYVRACATWTPNAMLRAILTRCGLRPAMSAAENLSRVVSMLKARLGDPRNPARGLLIIDEADYLLARAHASRPPVILDTVRDLHDLSQAPIILVGEPELADTLRHNASISPKWRRFFDRVLIAEQFQPLSAAEIQHLASELTDLEVPREAAEQLERSLEGNLRLLVICLRSAERMACGNKVRVLSPEMLRVAQSRAEKAKQVLERRRTRGGARRAA